MRVSSRMGRGMGEVPGAKPQGYPTSRRRGVTSPDRDARVLRLEHAVAGLRAEAVMEGIGVDRRAVRAVLARRMLVDGQQLQRQFVAPLVAPRLRPAEEEALVAGEPVDHRCGLAAQ